MKIERTIEVTFETSETRVVRRRREIAVVWRDGCGQTVRMLKPEDAVKTACVSLREIYQAVEAGTVHFHESPDGELLVCSDSLMKEQL